MVLFVALTVLAATAQATPEEPDFSGRWVLTRTNVFGEAMKLAFLRIFIRRGERAAPIRADQTAINLNSIFRGSRLIPPLRQRSIAPISNGATTD